MYTPSFCMKANGIPILSKKRIDTIGEGFVRDFQPDILTNPSPLDIESFIEFYLGLIVDFQYLSHNGIYLGMTVFEDTDRVPVFDPTTNRAEYISAKAHTIIIDNRLLEGSQEHRVRFTEGHECGHHIFHPAYYSFNHSGIGTSFLPCRVDNYIGSKSDTRLWEDRKWLEWQANHFSASILMPKCAVAVLARAIKGGLSDYATRQKLVTEVSRCFDVSREAAANRLRDLGYIGKNDRNLYYPVYETSEIPLEDFFPA